MAGNLEGPGKNRTWPRLVLLRGKGSGKLGQVREIFSWGQVPGVAVFRRTSRQQSSPCPSPSRQHLCKPFNLSYPSFQQWEPMGKPWNCRPAGVRPVLCTHHLLKDALCGPSWCRHGCLMEQAEKKQTQALKASHGVGGSTGCPAKKLLTQVLLPLVDLSKQGVKHLLKNPAVPWKSAEWPFCTAPNVPGALPGFLMRYKR